MTTSTSTDNSNENGKRERNEDDLLSEQPSKAIKNENTGLKMETISPEVALAQIGKVENEESNIETSSMVKQPETANSENNGSETKTFSEKSTSLGEVTSENVGQYGATLSQSLTTTELSVDNSENPTPMLSNNSKAPVHDPRKTVSVQISANTVPIHQTTADSIGMNAPAVNSNQIIEERGEVSPLYVGRVIGKGGEMIRDLQARSGARIDVDQNVPQGHPRVITYKGTRETVEFAKQLVAILSREGASENDLPLGHASLQKLVIPAQSVGKVIGRGGEMIRELQSRSQAKIQIDHTGRSGHPPDQKLVTITGNKEAVAKGAEMVNFLVANPLMDAQQSLNMLIEDKTRSGLPWGSGPPYPNLPNQGINMNPQALQQTSQYGFGGGNYQQQFNAAPSMGYTPNLPMGMAPSLQQPMQHELGYSAAPGGREIDVIYASKQYMGRIIGSKGITVNDLQRRSGCEIQINQDVPPGQDCEITLKGTRSAIEAAKQMIKDIIEMGPQHPYAGGADTYGTSAAGSYQPAPVMQSAPQSFGFQQGFDQTYGQPTYNPPSTYIQAPYGQPSMPTQTYPGYNSQQQQYPIYAQQPMTAVQTYQPQIPIPPQQPKAPPPTQPSPWKTATAPDGQIYYYNERTGGTQWEKPAGMP